MVVVPTLQARSQHFKEVWPEFAPLNPDIVCCIVPTFLREKYDPNQYDWNEAKRKSIKPKLLKKSKHKLSQLFVGV